jgi:hypothetical protein
MNSPVPPYELPPQKKIQPVYEALAYCYGPLEWKPVRDPLSELGLTILSQHTPDVNRDRAFATMRERFPTWEQVRNASSRPRNFRAVTLSQYIVYDVPGRTGDGDISKDCLLWPL